MLAWSAEEPQGSEVQTDECDPEIIELPRLRQRFRLVPSPHRGCEAPRLQSLDNAGLFVVEEHRDSLAPTLLTGVERSLLLADATGTKFLLVANYPHMRPKIALCPFSIETVPEPTDLNWQHTCATRVYLYEIHVSQAFVIFPSLGGALYW